MKTNATSTIRTKATKTAVSLAVAVLLAVPTLSITATSVADSTGAYVTLTSFSGHPDVNLTVSGGNFIGNEAIAISATQNGAVVATSSSKADQSGQFSATIQLPIKLAQGAVTITATGQKSGLTSSNSYYAVPFAPTITASSSQTTPYSTLSVSGTGYAPNETVDLNLAGSTTTVQADASGDFMNATLATPAVPAASYTLIGAGEASGASSVAYEYINAFYPSASPSSYYVMPATTLGFTGSGFAANETVNVTDATTGAAVSSFVTSKTGSFTNAGGFTVPGSYAGLTKKFVLTGSLSHASTTTSTVIGQYYPNVTPTDYYVLPGGTISFNGSGFVPSESITITDAKGAQVGTITADSMGNITAAGMIQTTPSQAGTTVSYSLFGTTSHGTGTVSIQVGKYNPQASPSGYYLMPGSTLSFSGSGYAPNEVVNVFKGLTKVTSFTTDATGAFSGAGSTPIAYNQANSSVAYSLVGATSNQPIAFTLGVGQLNTQLTPSSYYVLPYAPFSVTVTGFAPNETVSLNTGATAQTNAKGTATFTNISLPYTGLSSATLTATGATSAATATASIGIGNYNPNVVAGNYYAKPGTTDSLTGSGFAPNETVSIVAGKTTAMVTADAKGAFTTNLVLPFGQTKNSLDIVSTGSLSNASSTTTITLAPYNPQVTPSTYYATPGTAVSFTGSGFVPGEAITVSLNDTQIGNETADAKGNLTSTGNYTLPFGKMASFTITGTVSGGSNTMTIGLAQFYAGVQLSSYYGNGGSVITASGSGYAPNETVTITSGATVLATVKADKTGAFATPITIPYAAPGKLVITASGANSQASPTTSYTVAQVYNSVGLANYAVPAGKAVTITGSGFFPGEPVTVTTDRTTTSYTFKADANGNLNDSGFVLPKSLSEGMLTLTINGTESYTSHDITMYVQNANVQ